MNWYEQAVGRGLIGKQTTVNRKAVEAASTAHGELSLMSEAEFQELVIFEAQSRGWTVAHFTKVRVQRKDGSVYWETPARADGAGYPDLHLVRNGRSVFMELKVGSNKPTDEQVKWHELLRGAGHEVYVFYPKDWDEIITQLDCQCAV